jgi:hypothetical protein
VLILIAGVQLSLRWESTAYQALGTMTLRSGQSFYGILSQDWSGDLVVRSKDDQALAVAALSNVSMMSYIERKDVGSPWRLIVGLLISVALATLTFASPALRRRLVREGTPRRGTT